MLQNQTLLNWQDRKREKKEEKMPRLKTNSSVGIKEQVSLKTSRAVFINAVRRFTPKALSSRPWFVSMKHFIYETVNTGLTSDELLPTKCHSFQV